MLTGVLAGAFLCGITAFLCGITFFFMPFSVVSLVAQRSTVTEVATPGRATGAPGQEAVARDRGEGTEGTGTTQRREGRGGKEGKGGEGGEKRPGGQR